MLKNELMMQAIYTKKAPEPVGPYSQAVQLGSFVFCSGQIPLDPVTSQVVAHDIQSQTRQVLENLKAVLQAGNMSFKHVVKSTVFLIDIKEFSQFNTIYESYFLEHKPARSCVEVSALPKNVRVEIELIAFKA